MTPTCSIGEVMKGGDARGPIRVNNWQEATRVGQGVEACEGRFGPLMVVSEDALMAKYPHGAWRYKPDALPDHTYKPLPKNGVNFAPHLKDAPLSLDQLREAVTVGGKCERCGGDRMWHDTAGVLYDDCPACHGTGREFTVCEKHRAMVEPRTATEGGVPLEITEPPKLNLTDLLRVECPLGRHGYMVLGRPRCPCGGESGTIPHPALTEAMEWAEGLGLDREKVS